MGVLIYAESISLFEKAIVTFFALKRLSLLFFLIKKVTKKSRKKVMLRTFFHARAQVISLLLHSRRLFQLLSLQVLAHFTPERVAS